ncbi:MAG: methyltransferase domain-containing protein [Candidatus Bathyarchaeia archaeon]
MSLTNWAELRRMALLDTYRPTVFSTSYWDVHAARFNENMQNMCELTEKQLNRLPLTPNCTVLDIGAGTGRLTIPIAKHVRYVTAVEPSKNMLNWLKINAEREKVNNIICANSPWERLNIEDIGLHDVVVTSFSLFMHAIEEALVKMHKAALRYVYLFLSASNGVDEEIQKLTCNTSIPNGLDYIYVYNILHNLGILANVEIWTYENAQCYNNLEDAILRFTELYNILPERQDELKTLLSKMLTEEQGKLWLKRRKKVAMVWWTKSN